MKRMAATSRETFEALEHTLARREAEVLDALRRLWRIGADPTAYELLRFMQAEHPTADLNAVRPRLTALRDAGLLTTTGKRPCAVTGRRAFTWGPPAQIVPTPLTSVIPVHAPAQDSLVF